jgi:hypothetical protein
MFTKTPSLTNDKYIDLPLDFIGAGGRFREQFDQCATGVVLVNGHLAVGGSSRETSPGDGGWNS